MDTSVIITMLAILFLMGVVTLTKLAFIENKLTETIRRLQLMNMQTTLLRREIANLKFELSDGEEEAPVLTTVNTSGISGKTGEDNVS